MDQQNLIQSIDAYKKQLIEVEMCLTEVDEGPERQDLLTLKDNITHLIELTEESLSRLKAQSEDEEYKLFMSEMEKEGAVSNEKIEDVLSELQSIEGQKCRAPHTHKWGDTVYHNAIVCSTIPSEEKQTFSEIKVKVMFINPTHQEMLPCPFIMDSDCKFSDEQCKYSHGEIVLFSSLQDYSEPNYEALMIGSSVLAKQENRLWGRAVVKQINGVKCRVKFESNKSEVDLELQDVLPLDDVICVDENSDDQSDDDEQEDVINMSLMNKPSSQALGDWEKHTKGIASKIMQQMGYIVGTGLGRYSSGRLEPVPALILPPGKSLDHCMNLREQSGGDKDLFNVEKKLKKLQKKQELVNQKAYEREKKNVNVFNFINETLNAEDMDTTFNLVKSKHKQAVKNETSRNLNVASMKIDEDIKSIQIELSKLRESLVRNSDVNSQIHKNLKQKLIMKQNELQSLRDKAVNISREQNLRINKKKMTVF